MVRGTPGQPRRHTVSSRLSDEEWASWELAREASGRREMGAWVRAVIDEVIGRYPAGGRPGDVARVPEVNAAAYEVLSGIANNLNQLTRFSHQDQRLAEGIEVALREVVDAAWAVRGLLGRTVVPPEKQP